MRIFSYFNNDDNKQLALDRISGLKPSLLDILDRQLINQLRIQIIVKFIISTKNSVKGCLLCGLSRFSDNLKTFISNIIVMIITY